MQFSLFRLLVASQYWYAAIATPRIEQIDATQNNRDFYPLSGKNSPNNLKILRAFLKDFKGAENVSWFKSANGDVLRSLQKTLYKLLSGMAAMAHGIIL
jgi:hypothetical protein